MFLKDYNANLYLGVELNSFLEFSLYWKVNRRTR